MKERFTSFQSPIGEIWIAHSGRGISLLAFSYPTFQRGLEVLGRRPVKDPTPFSQVIERLLAYFSGERTDLEDIPLDLKGSPFDIRVWQILRQIPYGEVRSYRWVAERLGNPRAARAVGSACRRNPVPIIVPCHRVVRSSGELGGYSGGERLKRVLLRMEGHEHPPYRGT